MGFTDTDRGCVGMTFMLQHLDLLLEIDTRTSIEAGKQFGKQRQRSLCWPLFHWYVRMQFSRPLEPNRRFNGAARATDAPAMALHITSSGLR